MAASIPALVEPSVLRWARESIDLSPVAAARRIEAAWEDGTEVPTIAQLRTAAEVYKRSLAVFFLPEPPAGFDTLRDFRRHIGTAVGPWSPGLHEDYRPAHVQRERNWRPQPARACSRSRRCRCLAAPHRLTSTSMCG